MSEDEAMISEVWGPGISKAKFFIRPCRRPLAVRAAENPTDRVRDESQKNARREAGHSSRA